MGHRSPLAIEFSTQLDRMEKLLLAAGITSPVDTSTSLPAVHLDVAECYKQLNESKNTRPEDIVMRQALELYCSLISPPATPTANFTSNYLSQQEKLSAKKEATSYERFHHEAQYQTSHIADQSGHDASKEHNRVIMNHSELGFYHVPHPRNEYTCSTVSSDQDISDSDDMDDDPFASYPLSCPNGLAAYSRPGLGSRASPAHHGRPHSGTLASKGSSNLLTEYCDLTPSTHAPTTRYGNAPAPSTSSGTLGMSKAASIDSRYSSGHSTSSQATHFNLNVQPTLEAKPSGRKRAFSVVSLTKHRKVPSGGATALRISGPISSPAPNTSSSIGTFSAQAQHHRSSGRRMSLLGCLSPAMEESEDITPYKIPPSHMRARSSTSSSLEQYQVMNISNKFSSRSESKSIWKTLKS